MKRGRKKKEDLKENEGAKKYAPKEYAPEVAQKSPIIVAIYLNVSQSTNEEAIKYMNELKADLNNDKTHDIIHYIFPVREGQTRMELIYPPPTLQELTECECGNSCGCKHD